MDEPGSDHLGDRLRGCRLVSSALSRLEVARAARRREVEVPAADRVFARIAFRRIDTDVLSRAAALDPPQLRSLDAIHLATALLFAPELEAFLTYDRQLGRAAEDAGLPVEGPR